MCSTLNLKYFWCLLVCVNRYLYVLIVIARNGLVKQVTLWLFSSHSLKRSRFTAAIGHQRLSRTLRHPSTPLMQWWVEIDLMIIILVFAWITQCQSGVFPWILSNANVLGGSVPYAYSSLPSSFFSHFRSALPPLLIKASFWAVLRG